MKHPLFPKTPSLTGEARFFEGALIGLGFGFITVSWLQLGSPAWFQILGSAMGLGGFLAMGYRKPWQKDHPRAKGVVDTVKIDPALDCVSLFRAHSAPLIKTVCLLGSARAQAYEAFAQGLELKPMGCDPSEFHRSKLSHDAKARIKPLPISEYLHKLPPQTRFDLIYVESFASLKVQEVPKHLNQLAKICPYLYFDSYWLPPTRKDDPPHTRRPREFWEEQLVMAGFQEYQNLWDGQSGLWVSLKFETSAPHK